MTNTPGNSPYDGPAIKVKINEGTMEAMINIGSIIANKMETDFSYMFRMAASSFYFDEIIDFGRGVINGYLGSARHSTQHHLVNAVEQHPTHVGTKTEFPIME